MMTATAVAEQPVVWMTDAFEAKLEADYRAFASLAKFQWRLSWVALRRAAEAETAANLADFRYFAAEARRLRRDAAYHLQVAHEKKAQLDA